MVFVKQLLHLCDGDCRIWHLNEGKKGRRGKEVKGRRGRGMREEEGRRGGKEGREGGGEGRGRKRRGTI